MKTATHRHCLNDLRHLHYLVTDKGVFILINREWRKSSVELSELKPLKPATMEKSYDMTSRKLVGTHRKTNEVIAFDSIVEAAGEGFAYQSISKCLSSDQKTHKGYKWEWAA